MLDKSYVLFKKIFGESHLYSSLVCCNIGLNYYQNLAKYALAVEHLNTGLRAILLTSKEKSIYAVIVYRLLGNAFRHWDNHQSALVNCQRALAISLEVLGAENLETAHCQNGLGIVLGHLNRFKEALEHCTRALAGVS